MDIELTREGKRSIALIYKAYLERRSKGEAKTQATFFASDLVDAHAELAHAVRGEFLELKRAGLLNVSVTGCFELTDRAIVYMESKTPDTLKEWLSLGAQVLAGAAQIISDLF